MVRPQEREATHTDPDAANTELCDETLQKFFLEVGHEWKVIEERLVAVVSDGAGNMGAHVDRSWVEASSCFRQRVFSYVTATDYGQSTEHMCETLWVRCTGEAPEG